MKKSIFALFFIVAASTSMAASAAEIKTGTPITTTDCKLLGEQVTLNLSNNVSGAYSCDEITSTIKVAACHKAGSRKAMDVKCAIVTQAEGDEDAVWNDPSCKETTDTFESSDYRGYVASSKGGSVAQKELGGNCTAASAEDLLK